jgi:signal transduction histidine kinase
MAARAHAHGGRVDVVSPVGAGTTIVVTLPCA